MYTFIDGFATRANAGAISAPLRHHLLAAGLAYTIFSHTRQQPRAARAHACLSPGVRAGCVPELITLHIHITCGWCTHTMFYRVSRHPSPVRTDGMPLETSAAGPVPGVYRSVNAIKLRVLMCVAGGCQQSVRHRKSASVRRSETRSKHDWKPQRRPTIEHLNGTHKVYRLSRDYFGLGPVCTQGSLGTPALRHSAQQQWPTKSQWPSILSFWPFSRVFRVELFSCPAVFICNGRRKSAIFTGITCHTRN